MGPGLYPRGNMLARYEIGDLFKGFVALALNTLAEEMLAMSQSRCSV